MDFSNDTEFKQKRDAIHADLLHIKDCLSVHKGFEEAITNIEHAKIHRNPRYVPFEDFIRDSLDHVIIIHLWNLIGKGSNNKHNLYSYMDEIGNDIDGYVRTFLHEQTVDEFINPAKEIRTSVELFNKYLESLNNSDNSFYMRLKKWRDQVYAHIDQNVGIDRFMSSINESSSQVWENENKIKFTEIEEIYSKIWEHFHAIDRTEILQVVDEIHKYEIQPAAYDVMNYFIAKSKEDWNNL